MSHRYPTSRGASSRGVDPSGLQLPTFIETVLADFGLLREFLSRPRSLQLGLVTRIVAADRQDLRDERIAQMLDELMLDPDPASN
jgi:hypothetical protein